MFGATCDLLQMGVARVEGYPLGEVVLLVGLTRRLLSFLRRRTAGSSMYGLLSTTGTVVRPTYSSRAISLLRRDTAMREVQN